MQLTKLLARLGLAAVLLSTLNLQLSTAFAQGTAFTYQGVLSQGGAAVNGSNDLTFTLYNAVSAGATVGTSNVVNDLVMSNGLFTVTLDFGAGAFDGSARWLQIAGRPGASTGAYTNLVPRTSITPTPYAIYAGGANAANLVGTVVDARLSANVGLRAGGNAFSGNQIITGGNVGIGTATPSNLLDVAASGVIGNSTVLGLNIHDTLNRGTKVSFGYNVPGSEFNGMRAVVNPGTALCGNSGDLLFHTWECNTAPSREVMRINGRGNVGVGTNNPSAKLHVIGNILASGNVGIGIAAPSTKLHVAGGGDLEFSLQSTDNNRRWTLQASGGTDGVGLGGALQVIDRTAGAARMVFNTAGRVGIGGIDPATKLTVYESTYGIEHTDGTRRLATYIDASGCYFGTVSPDPLLFYINDGATSMALATNGNVGIGTTTPTTKLEVAGEVTCTAVNITSDRNAKEQFKPVNAREVLAKVARLPISEWQFKTQSDARHIGPMAQDFHAAFAVGRDDKHITSVDADGVALAAIQGLNEKVDEQSREKDTRIQELEKTVAELKELVSKLAVPQNGGAR